MILYFQIKFLRYIKENLKLGVFEWLLWLLSFVWPRDG